MLPVEKLPIISSHIRYYQAQYFFYKLKSELLAWLPGCTGCDVAYLISVYLKVHTVQVVGVSFLMLLKQQGIPGSILADEMGLGKTAQAICFLGMCIAFVNHVISA